MSNEQAPGTGEPRKRRGLDGRVIGGRYQVTRTVAAGANTLIADALDKELDRQVTIKLVRPELSESEAFRRHIRQQMEAVAAVSHPNLAAVYDWGEERIGKRTTVYVVCEYLSGGSLRDLFDRKRMLTPSQALMVGLEACRGLDFAHRKGLVHTELTPSKLVFGDDRRLRIVDFGLARILGEQVWKDPSQVPTHVARYASPEQALAGTVGDTKEPIDGRTDVYSLALILVEAVTGSLPFQGDSTVATLSARIGKLMPVSADLGPLASVLERAGRPEPSERATASQFGRTLVRAAERMPRPTPIPILSTALFEDASALRRPNDPTGGIARPPAEPEPALVPPSTAQPDDPTVEVTGPVGDGDSLLLPDEPDAPFAPEAPVAPPPPDAQPAGPDASLAPAISTDESAGDAADSIPAAPSLEPTSEAEGDADHEFIDLAELVGRTPQPPPPTEAPAEPAVRGRKGKKDRKQRKADKAAAKAGPGTGSTEDRAADGASDDRPLVAPGGPLALVPPERGGAPAPLDAGKPRHRLLGFLFGLGLVAVLAGLGVVAWKLFRTPTHEVPDVAGLTQDEALDLVDDFKWEIDFKRARSDRYDTPGQVVRTTPEAGDDLAEGSPLLIEISEGPEYRQIPNLTGMTIDEATAALDGVRLIVGTRTDEFDPVVPAGAVLRYGIDGPMSEQGVLPGVAVNLVVSQGPAPIAVPDLVGRTTEQAQRLLEQFGLNLAVGEPVFSTDIESGQVATQDPLPDAQITPGGTITVAPSKGPDLVAMPDLTGQPVPQIRETLVANGLTPGALVGSTQGVFLSATVNGEEVEPGAQILRGSTVDFIALPPG